MLKAYHRWGADCVDHFLGMFAFAVAERDTGGLVLARDRLGIKPLYLAADAAAGCGSPPRCPRCWPAATSTPRIDPVALHHYMTFHSVVPAPRTILAGVRKLPPATIRMIEPDGTQHASTSTGARARPQARVRRAEHADDWHDAVAGDAAAARCAAGWSPTCRSACCCPAGSTRQLIVALLAAEGQHGLKTFSIGFEAAGGEAGDEFEYSDLIAKEFDTDHHQILIDPARLLPAVRRRRSAR